jgi:uncharacterized protein (TIGR02145 family)
MKFLLKPYFMVLLLTGLIPGMFSCTKDKSDSSADKILIPTLTTAAVSSVTLSSAISGGSITSDGGGTITTSGICWATTANPTIGNSKTTDGGVTGSFVSSLTGLTANTLYYTRAYATNSAGTGYGEQVQFNTLVDYTGQTGTISDVDGNSYPTVGIGSQIWMAANLKTTKYRNGSLIGTTSSATLDITSETTPKYQWAYAGNENNVVTYGRLYTWHAVTDSRSICPTGWHVPSDAEWSTLTTFAGGESAAGGKLKETGTIHWNTPNTLSTNIFSFTALPGGDRDVAGTFSLLGANGGWWSTSENTAVTGWFRFLFYDSGIVSKGYFNKNYGFAVRCLKDN